MNEGKVCQGLGKLWDPTSPECAGGPDPAYISEVDGSNTRPRCPWFAQCAAATNANKLGATPKPQSIPVHIPTPTAQQVPNVPRMPAPTPMAAAARGVVQGIAQVAANAQQQQMVRPPIAPAIPPAPVRSQPWTPPATYHQPFLPQQQPYAQAQMAPPQAAMMPYMVPMNMPAPGMHMLGYLAVPEPMMEGQHWASRLGLSILRAAFKATGHTVANFFDFTPFGRYPTEGG
jgi:hypothetical protein